jgi:nucleoside phosphorylase
VGVVNPQAQTLVCFALKEEAAAFRRLTGNRDGIRTLITGIGRKNAEKSVREFLKENFPRHVFTCGFAGGLNPELKTGDVIFFTDDASMARRLAGAGATPAQFHCAARIAITSAEKAELRRLTNADAVEMESEAIQTVCRARGIPCATARAISDAAGEDLPLDFNLLVKADANLGYARLAWTLAKAPGKIPALRRLQKRTRGAAEELGKILAAVI